MNEQTFYEMMTRGPEGETEKRYLDHVTALEIRNLSITTLSDLREITINETDSFTISLDVLSSINEQWFKNVKSITLIDFASNYIPEFVFRLPKLEDLCLNMIIKPESLEHCMKLKRLTRLAINDAGLTEIPAAICKLKNLEELDLANNQIRFIPDDILNLSKLQKLSLVSNGYRSIPEIIFSLPSLTYLNLRSNHLTDIPESISKAAKLELLFLMVNDFYSFPDNLLSLHHLKVLDISQNRGIGFISDDIGKLISLQHLNVSSTSIRELPDSISKLTDLIRLNAASNQIEVITDSICRLMHLQELCLNDNLIGQIPDSISDLTELRNLEVNYNSLTGIPESISKLQNLTSIDLSNNCIQSLPESLGELKNLQSLYLGGNSIDQLNECINSLDSLTTLELSGNNLSDIPFKLDNLKNLNTVLLNSNPIQSISCLQDNKESLTNLYLGSTKIKALPEFLRYCKKLKVLDLSNTDVSELPDWMDELQELSELDISGLTLKRLPLMSSLFKMQMGSDDIDERNALLYKGLIKNKTRILLQPASLFDQPFELIEDYYKSSKTQVSEAKIIFIGYGNKGKTYTLKRILNDSKPDDYQTSETHGINIEDYHTKTEDDHDLKITFWDFGGQQIMHSMHQCFLTERTGYVIFLNSRDDDGDLQAEKWIRNIRSFAPNSRILVYVNLWENSNTHRLNEQYLKNEYGVEVISCSAKCASKEEFEQNVTKPINKMASELDSYVMEFPEKWNNIRSELRTLKNNDEYYITLSRYYEICHKNGEDDRNICLWLLELFNDMGECFSFGDYDFDRSDDTETVLNEYRVLEPKWLTKGIYSVIYFGKQANINGEISKHSLNDILKTVKADENEILSVDSYTPDEVTYILEIMRKFNMSYEINKQEEFIPSLIQNKDTSHIQREPAIYVDSRKYEMEYTYLPDALIHQVMVECYRKNVRPTQIWSKGFVFESEMMGIILIVNGDGIDNILRISIYTLNGIARPQIPLQWMLNVIRQVGKRLNLFAKEWVLPEDGIKDRISIDELNDLLACGQKQYSYPDMRTRTMVVHEIRDLLCRVIDENTTEEYLLRNQNSMNYSNENLTELIRQKVPVNLTVNNYNYYGPGNQIINHIESQQIINSIGKDPDKWLFMFNDHADSLNINILNMLGDILSESKDAKVKKAGAEIKKAEKKDEKKSLFSKLVDGLKGINEGFKLTDNVTKYWPLLLPYLQKVPELWQYIQNLISTGF